MAVYTFPDLTIMESVMQRLRDGVLTEIPATAVLERSNNLPAGVNNYLVYGVDFNPERFYIGTIGFDQVVQLDIFSVSNSKAKRIRDEVVAAIDGDQINIAGWCYADPRFNNRTFYEDDNSPVVVHLVLEIKWIVSRIPV